MSTVLLRLSGPIQAWGTQSRFYDRDTGIEPSKSGVIGLVCAALGRPRDADVSDLAGLRFGIREDVPGSVLVDYQTAGAYSPRSGHYPPGANASLSHRYYLADARFLAGFQGDPALVREIDLALAVPRWQLYLGRKACPPGEPVRLPPGEGVHDRELVEALGRYPWLGTQPARPERLRMVVDAEPGPAQDIRNDVPLSFAQRAFTIRHVETLWVETPS